MIVVMAEKREQYATHHCGCGCGLRPRRYDAKYVAGHAPLRPLRERLYSRVVRQDSGCLIWLGAKSTQGYGQIGRGRSLEGLIHTHVAAWEIANGRVPDGLYVLHRCDNRPCLEVGHLFLGTHQDNMADMKAKGRGRGAEGQRNANAKLTMGQVEQIRFRYHKGVHPALGTGGSSSELAREFGVTPQYVNQLARGQWRKKW